MVGKFLKSILTLLFMLILLYGCSAINGLSKLPEERVPLNIYKEKPRQARVKAQSPTPHQQPDGTEGSLWRNQNAMASLFVDYKARSVGDIVTVAIVEDAKASNDAGTNTGKQSDISAHVKSFLGAENKYTDESEFPNPFGKVSGGLENSFTGKGKTERSGKIKAEITVRVVEVLPNGNLKVEGARIITINSERQFIVLDGVIRPRDISSDNRIASTRISNARIVYSGTGVVDEQLRQGWVSRILFGIFPL